MLPRLKDASTEALIGFENEGDYTMRERSRRGGVHTALRYAAAALAGLCLVGPAAAKDLGDILVEKGLITPDELRQAREEEKQKVAAEESRRDAISREAAEMARDDHALRRPADPRRGLLRQRPERPNAFPPPRPHRLEHQSDRRDRRHVPPRERQSRTIPSRPTSPSSAPSPASRSTSTRPI